MTDELAKYTNALRVLKNIAEDETCPSHIADYIYHWIDELSYLDVMPVRHGYWEVGYFHDRVCSCCAHPDNDLDNYPHTYCPNCGARMDKKKPWDKGA